MIRSIAPRLVLVVAAFGLATAAAGAQGFGTTYVGTAGRGGAAVGLHVGHDHDHGRGRGRFDRDGGRRTWRPGRYEIVAEQVWVPGEVRRVWREPVFVNRYDACGRLVRVCVSEGSWTYVQDPGCYRTRYVRVWRDGCWD